MTPQSTMPRVSERLSQHLQELNLKAAAIIAAEETADLKRIQLNEMGPEALQRLLHVAEGSSGQSHHCRRVLLSVYNGAAWPLDPTRLRVIDRQLQDAALTLIEWSIYSSEEPHEYLPNGHQLMQRFAAIEKHKEQ